MKLSTKTAVFKKESLLIGKAVVSQDMSRSRDTIFQSLGLEGVKYRSRLETLKSRKTSVSRGCFYKFASKLNEDN